MGRSAFRFEVAAAALLAANLFSFSAEASADEGAGGAVGSATFHYRGASLLRGHVEGFCSAAAATFDPAASGLRFESAGGVLERYVTEWRVAAVQPSHENSLAVPLTAEQATQTEAVPAGSGVIRWDSEARAAIFGPSWPSVSPDAASSRFEARFSVASTEAGPLTNDLRTQEIPVERDGVGWMQTTSVPGWARWIRFGEGTLELVGGTTLLLEDAEIFIGAGFHRELPPAREEVLVQETDAAGYYQVRVHHALLRLTDARVEVDGGDARVACGDLSADTTGVIGAFDARGTLVVGTASIDFARRELFLDGAFRLREAAPGGDGASRDHVTSDATGWFRAASLDFQPVAAMGTAGPAFGGPVAWSAAAAAAALVVFAAKSGWLLFTRLHGSSLLDLETRNLIVEALRVRPWARMGDLRAATGLGRSTLRYHLGVLVRHHVVRAARTTRSVHFTADASAPPPDDVVQRVLRRQLEPGPRRLAKIMRELVRERPLSRFGAWKVVQRAARKGTVRLERRGREVWARWSG